MTTMNPVRRTRTRRSDAAVLLIALALGLLAVTPAVAQTPVSALGLGVPIPSIDARAAALGGTGLGLPDGSLSARNPADIALFEQPVLGITYAPEGVTVKGAEGSLSTGRSRLGVLRGAVPIGDWAVGLAFAPELDQDWQVSFSDTLVSEDGTFPFTEQRSHDGGVSSVNLTAARRLGRLSLGAEYAIITGRLQQRFRRDFEGDVSGESGPIGAVAGVGDWEYSGSRFRFGAAAAITDRIHLGADLSIQKTLTATRDSIDGVTRTRKFDMPVGFELGASARVSERLLVTGAGGWTGWEGAEGNSGNFVASNVTWIGIGAELTGTRLLGAQVPLRFGLRRTDLPFHAPEAEQLSETAATFGLGVRVAEDKARIDLALEVGSRGDLAASGIEESFQRLSISLSLFQN
jgi:hypothetical protein